MKSKIILALTLLITLAVTGANAQAVRERGQYNEGMSKNFRHGKISKHDRHRLARERSHYRKNNFRGKKDGHFSHHDKRYLRSKNRKARHQGYGYRPHSQQRKFD